MRERLIRVLIIGLLALAVLNVAKTIADWKNQSKIGGESVSLPTASFKERLEELGGRILEEKIESLPGFSKEETQEEELETEPIEEPVEDIHRQTEALIEAIKNLPQDQLEATKKQIYKDFCEGVLSE